jgi:hypothetical protein
MKSAIINFGEIIVKCVNGPFKFQMGESWATGCLPWSSSVINMIVKCVNGTFKFQMGESWATGCLPWSSSVINIIVKCVNGPFEFQMGESWATGCLPWSSLVLSSLSSSASPSISSGMSSYIQTKIFCISEIQINPVLDSNKINLFWQKYFVFLHIFSH